MQENKICKYPAQKSMDQAKKMTHRWKSNFLLKKNSLNNKGIEI